MKLKTINIKGKEYVMVNERIRAFRELYPQGCIKTEVIKQTDVDILMCAKVYPEKDIWKYFTGHAFEKNTGGMVNTTSHVENCETSAVGRALGFLGIGVDTSIATAEEVGHAIKQQEAPQKQRYRSYNGVKYPHVTDILNPDPLPIPTWHLDVGTQVDLYMKAFFTKKPYIPSYEGLCNDAVKNLKECIEACQAWLMDFGSQMEMKEIGVILINFDDIYTGTDDMECIYENLYTIVDFKKTKNLDKRGIETYAGQLAAYSKARRFDKKERPEIEQLVIASPFNDPVCIKGDADIDKYYEIFLEKRKEYKKRFKM